MATEILQRLKNLIFGLPEPQSTQNLPVKAVAGPYLYGGQTGGGKWFRGLSSSGSATAINAAETLQNARNASHESTQARLLINRPRDITVDQGLKLEPTPAWSQLGITDDDFKERWTTDHEERFDMYMSSKQCHRSETMTGYQVQRLWKLMDERDNDQFGRFYYNRDRRLMSPLQLELIDSTQICGTAWLDTYGNYGYIDGIQRDSAGKELSYLVRIKKRDKNGVVTYEKKEIPARGARSKRIFMFHGYEQEYAGQGRGFSKLHSNLQDFENIVDYVSAVTKKAINQSGMVGFIEPSENNPASNPFEDNQGGPIPLPEGLTVTDNTESGEFQCIADSEYTSRIPGSDLVANLREGEKIKFLEDTAPGPQFDAYITSIFKHVSASKGWPIEVILMAFNSNYSASRAALLEAWRTGRIGQADLKADLMDNWWEMWLAEEIAAGRTQAPGWNDPLLKQAWMKYRLQGPPLPSISPRDDLAAIGDKLKFGLTTQDREARAINNSDARQNNTINTKMFAETPTVPWEDKPEDGTEPSPGEGSSDND
jgi:capsid protein